MPPESIRDRAYSEKSDVWAYGVTVYEIVSRSDPFSGKSLLEVAVKIRDEGYTVLKDKYPDDCPKYLLRLMEWCFTADPLARPTFKDIGHWLEENAPEEARTNADEFAATPSALFPAMGDAKKQQDNGGGVADQQQGVTKKKSKAWKNAAVNNSEYQTTIEMETINPPSRDYGSI
jgi:serine/threonine protein kinase